MANSRNEGFHDSTHQGQLNEQKKQAIRFAFDREVQSVTGAHYGSVYNLYASTSIKKGQEDEEGKKATAIVEEENRAWTFFCHNLKIEYRKGKYIERLFYPNNLLPLEGNYIHLTLVDDKQGAEAELKLQQNFKKKYLNKQVSIKPDIQTICLMLDDGEPLKKDTLYLKRIGHDLVYAIVVESSIVYRGSISQKALEEACPPEKQQIISFLFQQSQEQENIRPFFKSKVLDVELFESEVLDVELDVELVYPLLPTLLKCISDQQHYIHHQETEIVRTYEELFNPTESCELFKVVQHKHVLITGIAGVGKTTLSQYLCYVWAQETSEKISQEEKKRLEKFKAWRDQTSIIIRVALRDLLHDPEKLIAGTSAIDFLWNYLKSRYNERSFYEESSLLTQEQREETLKHRLKEEEKAGRLVLVLDGYDEVAKEVYNLKHLEILLKKLLSMARLILTSRPYYLDDLSTKYRCRFETMYRVTGFSDHNIYQYIDNFFSHLIQPKEERGIALTQYLQRNRSLWGTCHVPINLELICSAWDHHPFKQESLTITDLYDKVVLFLCRRYLQKSEIDISLIFDEDILEYCQQEIDFLKHLAFLSVLNQEVVTALKDSVRFIIGNIQLAEKDLPKWKLKFIKQILQAGFLKSIKEGGNEAEKHYYFPHRTFQEYFAARYFVDCLLGKYVLPSRTQDAPSSESVHSYIMENRYDVNLEVMWWFVAGQLSLHQQNNFSSPALHNFFNKLLGPGDTIGHYRFMLAVRCWDETHAREDLLSPAIQNSLFLGFDMLLGGMGLSYLQPLRDRVLLSGFICRSQLFNQWIESKINQFVNVEKAHPIQTTLRFANEIEFIPDIVLFKKLLHLVKEETSTHRGILVGYLVELCSQVEDDVYKEFETEFMQLIQGHSLSEYISFFDKMEDEDIKFKFNRADRILSWLEQKDPLLQSLSLVLIRRSDDSFFGRYFKIPLLEVIEEVEKEPSLFLYLNVHCIFRFFNESLLLEDEVIWQYLMDASDDKEDMTWSSREWIEFYGLLRKAHFIEHIDLLLQHLMDLEEPCATSERAHAILSLLYYRSDWLKPAHLVNLIKLFTQQPYHPTVKTLSIVLLDQLPLFVKPLLLLELLLAKRENDLLACLTAYFENAVLKPANPMFGVNYVKEEDASQIMENWKRQGSKPGEVFILMKDNIWEAYLILVEVHKKKEEDFFLNINEELWLSNNPLMIEKKTISPDSDLNFELNNKGISRIFFQESSLALIKKLFSYGVQSQSFFSFVGLSHPEEVSKTALDLIEHAIIQEASLEEKATCYRALVKRFPTVSLALQRRILCIIGKETQADLITPLMHQITPLLLSYWIEGNIEKKMIALPWVLWYLPLTSEDTQKCMDQVITILTQPDAVSCYDPMLSFFSAYYFLLSTIIKELIENVKKSDISDIDLQFRNKTGSQCFQSYITQIMRGASEEGKRAWYLALCAMPQFIIDFTRESVLQQELSIMNELTLLIYNFRENKKVDLSRENALLIPFWKSKNTLSFYEETTQKFSVFLSGTLLETCKQSAYWVRNHVEKAYKMTRNDNHTRKYILPPSISDFIENISGMIGLFQSVDTKYDSFELDLFLFSELDEKRGNHLTPRIDTLFRLKKYLMESEFKNMHGNDLKRKPNSTILFRNMIKEIGLGNELIEKLLQSQIYYLAYNNTIRFFSSQDLSHRLRDFDLSQLEQLDIKNFLEKIPLKSIIENYCIIKEEKLISVIVQRLVEENKTIEMRENQIYLHGKTLERIPHQLTHEEQGLLTNHLYRAFDETYRVNPGVVKIAPAYEAADEKQYALHNILLNEEKVRLSNRVYLVIEKEEEQEDKKEEEGKEEVKQETHASDGEQLSNAGQMQLMFARDCLQQNNLDHAIVHYRISLQDQQNPLSLEEKHGAYYELACCYHITGEWDEANQYFLQAIEQKPLASIYCDYGLMLMHQSYFFEAIGWLTQAIQQSNDGSYLYYGLAKKIVLDDYLQQEISQEKNLNIKPILIAYYWLIRCYQKSKQLHQAQACLEQFTQLVEEERSLLSYRLLFYTHQFLGNAEKVTIYQRMIEELTAENSAEEQSRVDVEAVSQQRSLHEVIAVEKEQLPPPLQLQKTTSPATLLSLPAAFFNKSSYPEKRKKPSSPATHELQRQEDDTQMRDIIAELESPENRDKKRRIDLYAGQEEKSPQVVPYVEQVPQRAASNAMLSPSEEETFKDILKKFSNGDYEKEDVQKKLHAVLESFKSKASLNSNKMFRIIKHLLELESDKSEKIVPEWSRGMVEKIILGQIPEREKSKIQKIVADNEFYQIFFEAIANNLGISFFLSQNQHHAQQLVKASFASCVDQNQQQRRYPPPRPPSSSGSLTSSSSNSFSSSLNSSSSSSSGSSSFDRSPISTSVGMGSRSNWVPNFSSTPGFSNSFSSSLPDRVKELWSSLRAKRLEERDILEILRAQFSLNEEELQQAIGEEYFEAMHDKKNNLNPAAALNFKSFGVVETTSNKPLSSDSPGSLEINSTQWKMDKNRLILDIFHLEKKKVEERSAMEKEQLNQMNKKLISQLSELPEVEAWRLLGNLYDQVNSQLSVTHVAKIEYECLRNILKNKMYSELAKLPEEAVSQQLKSLSQTLDQFSTVREKIRYECLEAIRSSQIMYQARVNSARKMLSSRQRRNNLTQAIQEIHQLPLQLIQFSQATGLFLGAAFSEGDCFFDAFRESLREMEKAELVGIETLRSICGNNIAENPNEFKALIDELVKEARCLSVETYHNDIKLTQYEAWDRIIKSEGREEGISLWGNSGLEGRILCKYFKVKLHIMNIQDNGDINDTLITEEGETPISEDDKEIKDPNVIHIILFKNHFMPLLKNPLVQENVAEADIEFIRQYSNSITQLSLSSSQGNSSSSFSTRAIHARLSALNKSADNVVHGAEEKASWEIADFPEAEHVKLGDHHDDSIDSGLFLEQPIEATSNQGIENQNGMWQGK
jgi:hypothetical protein